MRVWAVVARLEDGAESLVSAWPDAFDARHACASYERQHGPAVVREMELAAEGELATWRRDAVRLNELRLAAEAEVARLEGLILRGWDDADAAAYADLETEARRIRAQRGRPIAS